MRLNVVRSGRVGAPPVVLVHGLGTGAATWSRCADVLSIDHDVLAVDLLGHGGSPAPDEPAEYTRDIALRDLDEVLAVLDRRAVLVGHSLGGYLSLAHAITRPGTDRALVVLNTGPGFRDRAAREAWNERSRRNAHRFAVPRQVTELNVHHDSLVIDRITELTLPVLVLVGDRDRPEFQASGQYFERKLPAGRLVVIEGGEHSMHESSHAVEIAELIRSFVAALAD